MVAWVDAGQPHEVQGVQSPHGNGGGIREAHVPGLLDDRRSRGHGHEFAIRAQSKPGRAEYLVAHLEVGHVPADARDLASEVGAENPATRPPYAERHAQWQPEPADREPEAAHLAVGLGGFGGAYPDEDLVVLGHRRAEVGEVQHLGWSVPRVGDGLHATTANPPYHRRRRRARESRRLTPSNRILDSDGLAGRRHRPGSPRQLSRSAFQGLGTSRGSDPGGCRRASRRARNHVGGSEQARLTGIPRPSLGAC